MKYIIFYAASEDNDYIPSYRIAYSKEDIPYIIKSAKDKFFACDFMVFELGEDVTKEFVNKNK